MKRRFAYLLPLTLACCTQGKSEQVADPRICKTPPREIKSGELWKCIHREAYLLARAPGSTKEIAEAVTTGCVVDLEQQVDKSKPDEGDGQREDLHYWAERAAFYRVTQARAGHCEIPN